MTPFSMLSAKKTGGQQEGEYGEVPTCSRRTMSKIVSGPVGNPELSINVNSNI